MNFLQFCDKHYDGMWLLAVGVIIALAFCACAMLDRPSK